MSVGPQIKLSVPKPQSQNTTVYALSNTYNIQVLQSLRPWISSKHYFKLSKRAKSLKYEHHSVNGASKKIIINIKDWTLWSVPSPKLQLLSPTFLRSSNCSPSLWSCCSMTSKGFGFVALFASVETSSVCSHLSCLVCHLSCGYKGCSLSELSITSFLPLQFFVFVRLLESNFLTHIKM